MRSQFPFPIISLYSSLLCLPKNCPCNPNRNQTEMKDCGAGSSHLLRTIKLFKLHGGVNASLIFTLWWKEKKKTRRCETKSLVCFSHVWDICCRQLREKPVKPNEPRWAAGHLFSGNTSLDFAPHHDTLHSQPSLPLPSAGVLSSRDSDCSYHNSSVLDYSHRVQETGGCQQATTADTDGSPDLWWLPYVTLLLQVCASLMFFFPSLISFFVFCSLKWPEWGWRGECRWGWTGSNSMPINTFRCKVGIQPQLEVYLSLNDYWEVKDCRVKATFYCHISQQEIICAFWIALRVHRGPWNWTHGKISHHNSFSQ